MKFSFRQILASAAGAVIAALIASSFGVTGTVIGVAIGSMAATLGTAFVSQSIERGQKAVKQVVVRVPEGPTSTLLRRMGGTVAAGGATSSVDGGPKEAEPTEVVGAVGDETTRMASSAARVDATDRMDAPAGNVGHEAPVTESLEAATAPLPPTAVVEGAGVVGVTGAEGVAHTADTGVALGGRRYTWKGLAVMAALVFVVALGLLTAVELIANRPLASIFGDTGSGPTLKNIFTPGPPATSTTTSTPTSSTTSTTAPSTTTSTTTSSSTTTSTTSSSTTTTTTNNPKATTTTTSTSGTTSTTSTTGGP